MHKCEIEQKTIPSRKQSQIKKKKVPRLNPHLASYLSVLSKSKHKIEQQNGISYKPETAHDIHRSS